MVRDSAAGFGALLRRYREAAVLSQEALANRAGLSVRGISDLERGSRNLPRLETVRVLADALGLDAEERGALVAARRPGMAAAAAHDSSTDPEHPFLPLPPTPSPRASCRAPPPG